MADVACENIHSFAGSLLRRRPNVDHPCAYMPFGYSPRNYIEMRFALLEIKMALVATLLKYKFVLIPEAEVRTCSHAFITPCMCICTWMCLNLPTSFVQLGDIS